MGSRRQRRVSWAAAPNLCKVRLFISEDSPSQAGLRPQDNLQAKGSCFMHAAGSSSDDSLPPGFESPQPTNDLKIDISQIPLIRWKCPSHILVDPDWHVASGEESKEIAIQNERMFGALEAMYPRASNIPPNPFVSPDVKDSRYDDSQTLLVPLIPVEDDDASDQPEAPLLDMPNNHHHSGKYDPERINVPQISHTLISAAQQQHYGSNGATSYDLSVEPDVLAAASAAFTAIMQSNQKGNMVDQDLLVKILSDPAQVERLTQEYNQIRHEQSRSSSVVAPVPPGPPPQKTVSASAPFSDHMTTFHNTNCTLPPPRMAVSAPVSASASFSDHMTTFQNTNSMHPPPRMALPPPMAPAPMMNRPPQGFPPVAMNRPLGSNPAMNSMNFLPGSSPAMNSMNLPPGPTPAMNSMNLARGPSPAMNAMNLPPSSNSAMNAMNIPPRSSPAMNLPPGSSQAMNFSSAPARGIPYYKTLIHQHGGERQEPPEQQRLQYGMYHQPAPPQTDAMNGASMVNRDTKLRPMKLCAYFNGPRGCRNGANCTFLHDTSARQDDSKGSKRIKLDSRIAGRN
ncbi:hypothetical protein QYE76_047178 [Lolium multiflorum]|uniref:C3H1-type domain-containing protein n=1 Tax=Lolium multiflorum TaxID=4521 RepID=A0AAD8TNC5_LOLMU|nr:hypothetical protein QYE76_047178 [Lolium multiflorum]